VRAYVHIDQSPRILKDEAYRTGIFGEDQGRILGAWDVLSRELEACSPESAIPATA
jgi:hypothetical protein